jgi:hypothetical protein
VVEAFHENLGMISILLMFIDIYLAFTMLSLYYTQHLGYLLHKMFQSLCILQHYTKFDTHTITSLEKLFGAGSSSDYINHLIYH